MPNLSSRFGYNRALRASARPVVLSPSGTYGSFPASAKPLALPVLKGSRSAPASEAPLPSARASRAKRPEDSMSGRFGHQPRAIHSVVVRSAAPVPSGVQERTGLCSIQRANPSIKRTVKGLRPSPAAYVKRWASQGTHLRISCIVPFH